MKGLISQTTVLRDVQINSQAGATPQMKYKHLLCCHGDF